MAFDLSSNQTDQQAVMNALGNSLQTQFGHGGTADMASAFTTQANQLGGTFSNLFKTFVGRDPSANEMSQFVNQYIVPNVTALRSPGSAQNSDPYTYLNQFISNTFQPQAKDYATQQLQGQQSQAAGLADQYRALGKQSLDSTSAYLQDYDQQLFNRLQPQIMTSLQAQGLLNTGGLNEAMAGAQKDLAGQAQGYLADANLQMNNQANQIQFGGAAAPYQYQQANIMNQLPYLQQQGSQAMGNAFNTFSANNAFNNQMALQNNYFKNMTDMQPSMLQSLGHSFVNSFGNSAGQSAAQMPFAGMQAYGQGNNSAMGAAMMGA